MPIKEFYIKDVRCFAGKNVFRLRPLTLIIGENSTGKSTVLGCMQALADSQGMGINFNDAPYDMGAFRNIIRKTRPNLKCFELGYQFEEKRVPPFSYRAKFEEYEDGTAPVITEQVYDFSDIKFGFEFKGDEFTSSIVSAYAEKDGKRVELQSDRIPHSFPRRLHMPHRIFLGELDAGELGLKEEELDKYTRCIGRSFLDFRSLAPLRSAPKRTYDPISEGGDPQGSDIPTMLMNLARKNKRRWESLRKQLIEYGKDSGLFTDIDARGLTKSANDPFQLQIKASGPKVNLIDVGYGISQALPIIINVIQTKNSGLLIQQPEVHLHPQGQAALATLIVKKIQEKENIRPSRPLYRTRTGPMYVLETHSDYIVDRTRIDIRQGKIAPDDVALIYLEKTKRGVTVHNITFDKKGNFENLPSNFRQFFLKEAHRLLGFED